MLYLKRTSLFYVTALLLIVILAGACNDPGTNNQNGYPFNAKNAQVHIMSTEEALTYTDRFRTNRTVLDSTLKGNTYFQKNPVRLLNGEYFNRDAIIALLNKSGNGGIRIYLGQDPKGTVKFILVPATEKTDVITKLLASKSLKIPGISSANAAPYQPTGDVMERGQECPEICPEGSIFSDRR